MTCDQPSKAASCWTLPCCLSKTHPLMHRDKKSRIYLIKISFLWNNQEFSSASFPHVFKAIGPLENNLETKNHFFSPFKKVTFSVSRILNAKTTKSDVFLTHFLNIDFIWGKSRFLKVVFYYLYLQLRFTIFIENIVCLYYGDFHFFHFHHTIDHPHSMFWSHNFTKKALLRP